MSKLLAAMVASLLAAGSAAGYAADTAKKKEELTREERADMRSRAERLTAERSSRPINRDQAVAAKKGELTTDERAEMRSRADRLTAQRAQGAIEQKTAAGKAPKTGTDQRKPRQQAPREGKPAQPRT